MRKVIFLFFVFFIALSLAAATPKKKTTPRRSTTTSTHRAKPSKPSYKLDKPGDPIDLGLSVMWSSTEIGATDTLSLGVEIQWGCIAPNENADKQHYKYYNPESYNYTKYFRYGDDENDITSHACDSTAKNLSIILDPEDDAARVLWGNGWRMPTRNELDELARKCTWKLIEQSDKRGYRVTGPNGNSIFIALPDPNYLERYYWSSCSAYKYGYGYNHEGNEDAWGLLMNSFNRFTIELLRYYGNWIRPVKDYETNLPDNTTSAE